MEEKIKEILAEELSVDIGEINLETNLKDDLNADSIDMMQVIDVLEQEFDVEVDTSELANIQTVGDILKYIERIGVDRFLNIENYLLFDQYIVTNLEIKDTNGQDMGLFLLFFENMYSFDLQFLELVL